MGFLNINKKYLPLKTHYFLFDAGNSPIIPFLSTIAKQRGYSPLIVGDIFTFLLLLNVVVKPLTGFVTDKYKCRKTIFLGSLLLNAFLTGGMYLIPGATSLTGEIPDGEVLNTGVFWLFDMVITLRMVLFMMAEVLQETITMTIVDGDVVLFGAQRLWGAVGWGLTSLVAGTMIDWYSRTKEHKDYLPGYLLSMTSLMLDFAVACRLKVPESDAPTRNIFGDVKKVMNAKMGMFLVWAMAGGIFTAYIWYYFIWYVDDLGTIYHPERKSILHSIQGFSLTIECLLGEVPFFYLSGHVINRTGHMTAFSISFAMYALRFLLYSVIRDPLWVLPVELMNGITFGLSYMAGISYSAKIAPNGTEGTVQGLFSMAFHGFGSSLGSTIAGYTFSYLGSVMAFRFIGLVALATCIVQVTVNHFMKRNSITTI
ncbi:Major facilitator superfamily domain,Major facilitator superfamily associated domain [Cinara cedri]|uniref:Major facilitator superfamily domain,Major facilitator superfamily associated domain n=1 Tax=Cinara cedri TaxID=506608 RepID=A0A5E4N1J5_9HEMI|nr:Major facilitator superfamily domain,Major facilitator superfamily associated domain [Cinara cedri]